MPDDVHIVISTEVREQLRELEPAERIAVVECVLDSLIKSGRPIMLPRPRSAVFVSSLLGYTFFFRELTRRELANCGQDHGYLVIAMKASPPWLRSQLGG